MSRAKTTTTDDAPLPVIELELNIRAGAEIAPTGSKWSAVCWLTDIDGATHDEPRRTCIGIFSTQADAEAAVIQWRRGLVSHITF